MKTQQHARTAKALASTVAVPDEPWQRTTQQLHIIKLAALDLLAVCCDHRPRLPASNHNSKLKRPGKQRPHHQPRSSDCGRPRTFPATRQERFDGCCQGCAVISQASSLSPDSSPCLASADACRTKPGAMVRVNWLAWPRSLEGL